MNVIKSFDIGSAPHSVDWDYTGQFLAVAAAGCVVVEEYAKKSKKWSEPLRKAISAADIAWGASAGSLAVIDGDGTLISMD